MQDMLPFPNLMGKDADEKLAQLNNYLIQFKETLEFVLTNISIENLSQDLVNKLNTLGADIEKSNEDRDDQIGQVTKRALTISDVMNSNSFHLALDSVTPKKYLVSAKQTQVSEEPEGLNIYVITNESGEVEQFTVKNGKTPKVDFTINFETGNLEYITS